MKENKLCSTEEPGDSTAGRPVAGGFLLLSFSFLSFTPSQIERGKGFPGSAGERVEAAPPREPAPPQQGIKPGHEPPNHPRTNLSANTRDAAPPLPRHRPPQTNRIILDRKVRGEEGRGVSVFFFFFPFLSLFWRVWGVGVCGCGEVFFVLPVFASSLLLPTLLKGAPGKTPRPRAGGDPHPGGSRCPSPPPPPTPVKPRQTHTNPNLSFLPPKTPTPGVQPGRRRGEAPPDPTGEQTHPAAPAARGPTGSGRPLPKMNLKKKNK